jgi:hypothetical protein
MEEGGWEREKIVSKKIRPDLFACWPCHQMLLEK